MEWHEYKLLCERPDHFSRWALALTAANVSDPTVRDALAGVTESEPLEKPEGHHGGEATDYFRIDVALQHAGRIVQDIGAAAARVEGRQQRRLNHLKVVWQEYTAFIRGLQD